jgi:hypothetical protein
MCLGWSVNLVRDVGEVRRNSQTLFRPADGLVWLEAFSKCNVHFHGFSITDWSDIGGLGEIILKKISTKPI